MRPMPIAHCPCIIVTYYFGFSWCVKFNDKVFHSFFEDGTKMKIAFFKMLTHKKWMKV